MAKSRTLQNLPEARLEEIRALRQGLPVGTFDPAEIEGFKGEGRP